MRAIKKIIKRKFSIPSEDRIVITPKDNTQRLAKALEDVIITEDDGSQYCMPRKIFHNKYDIIDTETCMSKPNEIYFILNTTGKDIVFTASWGEEITAYPNAAIVIENGKLGYAIQEMEFVETYTTVGIEKEMNK